MRGDRRMALQCPARPLRIGTRGLGIPWEKDLERHHASMIFKFSRTCGRMDPSPWRSEALAPEAGDSATKCRRPASASVPASRAHKLRLEKNGSPEFRDPCGESCPGPGLAQRRERSVGHGEPHPNADRFLPASDSRAWMGGHDRRQGRSLRCQGAAGRILDDGPAKVQCDSNMR
jgi:hypothetical protein